MGAMEISYSDTSVWVWQLAFVGQKKEGKKERKNKRMKEWTGKGTKEKEIEKLWASFVSRPQISLLHPSGAAFLSDGHNPAITVAEKTFGKQEDFFL